MENFNEHFSRYSYLKLSAQGALLGEVIPSLRGVAVGWSDKTILLYFYNDGKITDEIFDCFSEIGTEIISDFSDALINDHIIRLDYPQPLPFHEHWVFKRKEIKDVS